MPFEKGTFSMSIFKLTEELPENVLETFTAQCAGKLDDVADEPQVGWVSGRHLLERRIDDETAFLGGHLYLNLRIAQRKIPAALLKAEIKLEELAYMNANNSLDVPRRVKKDIKENVIEKRILQMVPQLSGIPFIIDKKDQTLYLGATSTAQIDLFLASFHETLKQTPIQLNADEIMFMEKKDPRNYNALQLIEGTDDDSNPGRDFLTWLWYFSEEEGGELSVNKIGKFSMMIDGPLSFISEGKGSFETVVRKGCPLRSAEATAALNVGKKLKKAKIVIAKDEQVWMAVFDADNFTFSSISLPEGEEMDLGSRFEERINYLYMFKSVFLDFFKYFLEETEKPEWKTKLEGIKTWAKSRESL